MYYCLCDENVGQVNHFQEWCHHPSWCICPLQCSSNDSLKRGGKYDHYHSKSTKSFLLTHPFDKRLSGLFWSTPPYWRQPFKPFHILLSTDFQWDKNASLFRKFIPGLFCSPPPNNCPRKSLRHLALLLLTGFPLDVSSFLVRLVSFCCQQRQINFVLPSIFFPWLVHLLPSSLPWWAFLSLFTCLFCINPSVW